MNKNTIGRIGLVLGTGLGLMGKEGAGGLSIPKQDGEFITAEAGDDIVGPATAAHQAGNLT